MYTTQVNATSMKGIQLARPSMLRVMVPKRGVLLVVNAKKNGIDLKIPGGSKNAKAGYDKSANREAPTTSAFTRRREIFAGRLAMSGFLAGMIGEILSGKGFIGQLSLETSLPPVVLNGALAAIVGFNVVTALNPASPTFSQENQQDVRRRPKGPVQNPKINPIENPADFLGIDKGFGFTRKNELFVGRVAMIGFASELIGEKLTGKGPLAQIGLGIGEPLNPSFASAGLALWVGVFLAAAVGYGTTDDSKYLGETKGDKRIF